MIHRFDSKQIINKLELTLLSSTLNIMAVINTVVGNIFNTFLTLFEQRTVYRFTVIVVVFFRYFLHY